MDETVREEILAWKARRAAVILAHNYQLPEVQDIADVVGDSLALARAASQTEAQVIVLCGVHFMAETAAILNPNRIVLLPDVTAGCSLADTITVEQLRAWKAEHPTATVVAYVNTTAAVKAESDYCCTSSNAVAVVQAIPPEEEILFLPDMFLGEYVRQTTGRKNMHLWPGECHVHAGIAPGDVELTLAAHPTADLLVHPECGCTTAMMYLMASGVLPPERTHLLSTSGMQAYSRQAQACEFVVATEVDMLYRLRRENPHKNFVPADPEAICQYMKKITLPKVLRSLQTLQPVVTVPPEIARRALRALERMVAIG